MAQDRVGSGSIPPEQHVDVDALWNALLTFLPEQKALEMMPSAACPWERWRRFKDLEAKVQPYLDRLPEVLLIEIGLGVSLGKVDLINAAHEDFLAWYFKEES